jgi:hypothetical protein
MVLLIAPIAILQFGLMIFNILNVAKKSKTKYLSQLIWILIIVFGGLLGNVVYLFLEGMNNNDNKRN